MSLGGEAREQVPSSALFGPAASWQVVDILSGTQPPDGMKERGIAYKTGTSYGYRDAWAVGFDGKRTIGVWVGYDRPRSLGKDETVEVVGFAMPTGGDLYITINDPAQLAPYTEAGWIVHT